nr:G-type lectin S-receptor-like serine/threonine-protein kinase RLK1 [Ipomoea batatas]
MVYTPFYFLIFVLLFPFHTFAQNNIAVGSTLIATDSTKPWLSPSGDFAFGFSQIQGKNQFLLCIWYANINERTIVWHANTTSPVPQGSTLRLDADSGLILSDPQGNRLWIIDGFVDKVDHGFLNDTGKFVLVGSDSTVLWDTFAHPTDTLLPTQEMEIGTMLVSRRSEANFSLGRFYLRMRDDGDLVLSTKMVRTNLDYEADYYNSQTSDPSNRTNSGYKVIFSEKGSISILKRNNATQELTSQSVSSDTENYLRLTLNFDGVLTLYRYPKGSTGNQSWIPLWSQPDNICANITGYIGSGACGYNSVCSIDAYQRPSCNCPQGYSLLDPSDQYGNCKPNYVQTCEELGKGSSEELFSLIEIRDTVWSVSDFEQINPSNKDDCRTACLNDCLCAVAIFRSNKCWKKEFPLSYGRIDRSLDVTAFLKVGKGVAPPLSRDPSREFPERKKKDKGILILAGSVLFGSSVFVDVYSFGKLLMEIIACRRSLQGEEICAANIVVLADWFIHCFQEKRMVLLVEDDAEALNDMEKVERFVMTAIWVGPLGTNLFNTPYLISKPSVEIDEGDLIGSGPLGTNLFNTPYLISKSSIEIDEGDLIGSEPLGTNLFNTPYLISKSSIEIDEGDLIGSGL